MKQNRIFIQTISLVAILLSFAFIASAQKVRYNFLPGTNFSQYKTYKWQRVEKAQLLDRIERELASVAASGRRTLLIVDEAQSLSTSALEELRMLSNFTAHGRALIQIVLLGQPEFRERLNFDHDLEQLRQRVIATHHLGAMERLPAVARLRI